MKQNNKSNNSNYNQETLIIGCNWEINTYNRINSNNFNKFNQNYNNKNTSINNNKTMK